MVVVRREMANERWREDSDTGRTDWLDGTRGGVG